MRLKIYPEPCCEDSDTCFETIHNHFDCPVCNKSYAGTSAYHSLWDDVIAKDTNFSCEECSAEFQCTNRGNDMDDWEWEHVK